MAKLAEVFKVSGVPTYTFVEPTKFTAVRVSFDTPGRCAVIEGPSGIGKTTCVIKILEELGLPDVLVLSARKAADREIIAALPDMSHIGIVVIDDFHRLEDDLKAKFADFMKVLADDESETSKLVIIGINKAGDHLVTFGSDLGLRIDVFRFETNSPSKVKQLLEKGETALNIEIKCREEIVEQAQGSFQIAQMLGREVCLQEDIEQTGNFKMILRSSSALIIERVMTDLARIFKSAAIGFAQGTKLRREGRAPYLHILRWLAEGADWSLDLHEAIRSRPEHRGSVGQVVDKDFLKTLMNEKSLLLENILHYQSDTHVVSVEDPRFVFYLRNLVWRTFTKDAGFTTEYFKGAYDLALSFAGEDRKIAKILFEKLTDREISVFYDENEQHRILASEIEEYLAPIYKSEANYVVPILSESYPRKIWTNFESRQFKDRFGANAVISISLSDAPRAAFTRTAEYGSLTLDVNADFDSEIDRIVAILADRLKEDRRSAV